MTYTISEAQCQSENFQAVAGELSTGTPECVVKSFHGKPTALAAVINPSNPGVPQQVNGEPYPVNLSRTFCGK